MLTVAEALELPILGKAQVVAGSGGLSRGIRWVHTVSVPDAADWLHGGELALTTMFNLPDEPSAQRGFVRQLAGKGIVAVVITIGSLKQNPYAPVLRRLLDEKADLFNTLETYLDVGGSSVRTAEALHIHHSTLNYRLARIGKICQVDLSSPSARINLQIALKLMRLFDDQPGA